MKDKQMRMLLQTLKENKSAFAVPEPDAAFEKRMLKRLRKSPEWKSPSVWSRLRAFISIEIPVSRFAVLSACVVLVMVASLRGGYLSWLAPQQTEFSQGRKEHPELNAMLQRGGAKALNLWVAVNGDPAAMAVEADFAQSDLSDEEQKRVLLELENKWSPAL